MARYLLADGVYAPPALAARSAGSWLPLLVILGVSRRDLLRVDRSELPSLALSGALLLVWLRGVHGRRRSPGVGAVALSLFGCFFVVRAYDLRGLDALGVLAAFGSMLTFAFYAVGFERSGQRPRGSGRFREDGVRPDCLRVDYGFSRFQRQARRRRSDSVDDRSWQRSWRPASAG